MIKNWQKTADYLSEKIPDYQFEAELISFFDTGLFAAKTNSAALFISSSRYVGQDLAQLGITPIACNRAWAPTSVYSAYSGAVVIFHQDEVPAPDWKDIKGRKIGTTKSLSFVDWLVTLREMREHGLKQDKDYHVEFLGTATTVWNALCNRSIDVAVLSATEFAKISTLTKLDIGEFTTIPCTSDDSPYPKFFPFSHSTRLYPRTLLAKTKYTSPELAEKITEALGQLPPDSPIVKVINSNGWITDTDFSQLKQCREIINQTPREMILIELYRSNPLAFIAFVILIFGITTGLLITAKLNKKLKEANATIQETTRLKSQFLANMSHEIRTPLNAVIGMTDLILETELDERQREFAEVTRVSGDSLMDVICDILDFSKIEAGELTIKEEDFNLRDCVEGAMELFVPKTAEKNIELICDMDDNVPENFRGDATRLRQIILNLLSNAFKFTDSGEIMLSVKIDKNEKGFLLLLSVRDTGIGIASDKLEAVFKDFIQADASTTRQYGGTGLGLAISRHLCELMGGKMWVNSIQGKGSTFHFTAQVMTAAQPVLKTHSEPVKFEPANRDILVVDDNLTNLDILCTRLKHWNLNPVSFDTPEAALQTIEHGQKFGLIITDMQMPNMDGLQLIRKIRKHRSAQELPGIVLSSIGSPRYDKTLGIASWLLKPAKPAQLHQKIAAIFCQGKAPQSAVRTSSDNTECSMDGLKILLAEDNLFNQKVALRMLEKIGIHADLAKDGIECVAMVEQKEYDLVLMDMQMPRMNGITATGEILKRRQGQTRPLIYAMTANADKKSRELTVAAGMDGYITKPVQLARLREVLHPISNQIRAIKQKKRKQADPERNR